MAVRHALLVLLTEEERHGSGLRAEFERRTGGTWPLNIGQVYTTLARLVRDGLVVEARRAPDGTVLYALTDAGRAEVARWWAEPVDRGTVRRDELAVAVALAIGTDGVDTARVVDAGRAAVMARLQQLTLLKRRAEAADDREGVAWSLLLDHLVFTAEADARWYDHVEVAG